MRGRALGRAASDLGGLLRTFRAATGCHASVWAAPEHGRPPARVADDADHGPRHGPSHHAAEPLPAPDAWPPAGERARRAVESAAGRQCVAAIPGVADAWVVVGPGADGSPPTDAAVDLVLAVVREHLEAAGEVEQAAHELSERYEEINLLYTISEILGRAVTLEETASVILTEVSETVGARRAAIFVYDRVTHTLQPAAVLGVGVDDLLPIAADDPESDAARVFRTLQPTIVDRVPSADAASASHAEGPLRDGAVLYVPIVWSTPDGGEPLGVVVLSGRRAGQQFTAGDLKLVTAIASQIAAAIQNARLVRASIQQQRMAQEMSLAHDLQMSLLPRADAVAPAAQVAARVVPAESVGGDFYQLVRLSNDRTGVMVGDVSSHGYRSALIMALTMSAAAIHAQQAADPAETLAAVLRSVGDELAATEMFISAVYAVVDPRAGEVLYANAGHPHAFVVRADGTAVRLPAGAPPLGMVPTAPACARLPWAVGEDLLVAFTDGVSEARDRDGRMLGEAAVLAAVRAARGGTPDDVVRRVFDVLDAHTGGAPPRDDLTIVVLRS